MKKPTALVLAGEGLNCEVEAAYGFRQAGFEVRITHVRDLLSGKEALDKDLVHFPGGFLHGDDLGSAKALSSLIRATRLSGKPFLERLQQYVADGGLLYGACNGFQCLVKLGMLPALDGKYGQQQASLTFNQSRKFEMRWVRLKVRKTNCPAFEGIQTIELPVRHGEGRFTVYDEYGQVRPQEGENVLLRLFNDQQVLLQYANAQGADTQTYPENPNGAINAIAGICDPTGRVFGLMPHPEGYLRFENHPEWHRKKETLARQGKPVPQKGQGNLVFENLHRFIQERID